MPFFGLGREFLFGKVGKLFLVINGFIFTLESVLVCDFLYGVLLKADTPNGESASASCRALATLCSETILKIACGKENFLVKGVLVEDSYFLEELLPSFFLLDLGSTKSLNFWLLTLS